MKDKMCPMKFNLDEINSETILCEGQNCAWWEQWGPDEEKGKGNCCLKSIAGTLSYWQAQGIPVSNS